jgi:hypothetical protein
MPPTHVYSHPAAKGLGQHHAEAAGREHPAEMRDLDMPHGTQAEHIATDEDTGALIVAWTDRSGITRHTAVQPDFFTEYFEPLAPSAPEGA